MEIIKRMRSDEEIQQLRVEWKEKMNSPFPLYNYDEYSSLEDYKEKIKRKLKAL